MVVYFEIVTSDRPAHRVGPFLCDIPFALTTPIDARRSLSYIDCTLIDEMKRSAFDLNHQPKAERVQRLNGAPHFAKIRGPGFSRNALKGAISWTKNKHISRNSTPSSTNGKRKLTSCAPRPKGPAPTPSCNITIRSTI